MNLFMGEHLNLNLRVAQYGVAIQASIPMLLTKTLANKEEVGGKKNGVLFHNKKKKKKTEREEKDKEKPGWELS